MTMQTINTISALSTPEAADLGLFLHRSTDADGTERHELETQEGTMDAADLAALRDLITVVLDKPQRPQLTLAPSPSDAPVLASCENVAGVQVSTYRSEDEGLQIALDTDETVHVEQLPALASHLLAIHKDHRFSEARSYFASADALDPSKHTMQSLIRFAEENGFDIAAFMSVAIEVMGR